MDQEKRNHNKNKHVKWDEDKLQQTQKYRGTFEKISQPKTPYHSNSQEEEEIDIQSKTPEQKLVQQSLKLAHINKQSNRKKKVDLTALNAQLKAQIAQYKEQQGEPMQEEQVQTQQQRKKKQQFKKKRADHYNQFKKIQQARQKWGSDQDD